MKKILFVVGAAIVIGIFMRFTTEGKKVHESVLPIIKNMPPFIESSKDWSDSTQSKLTLEEKIGQMLMVAAYPKKGEADKERVARLIKANKVGGVIFFQGTPEQVAKLSAYYQSISKIPLMIAIDGEWGLSMRLKNTIKYPKQMSLGAITDEMLIYEMGKDIGRQLRDIGVHVNFAPVVDINNNALNPVINSRSFGEDRVNVARKGTLYMKGMQDVGVLAFAKHFPGHGDTDTDSHHGLPIIHHTKSRLDSLELYPFRALINAGVGGIMIAHMNVLSLDTTPNLASTLSPKIVDSLLLQKMAFKGLVVTDAMNMKGVSGYYTPVEANIMAVNAGNDILLMPAAVEKSVLAIKKAVELGEIDVEKINASCRKILKAKHWIQKYPLNNRYDEAKLHQEHYYLTRKKLIEASLTVVKNKYDLLPLKRLDTLNIAQVKIGPSSGKDFSNTLKLYADVDVYTPSSNLDSTGYVALKNKLSKYNLVIISLHSNSISASRSFNVMRGEIDLIEKLISDFPSIFIGFVNPYVLSEIRDLNSTLAVVEAYENDSVTQSSTAQLVFGAIRSTGTLPISISKEFPLNTGTNTDKLERFKYVSAYEAGFDKNKLAKIDSIIANAIAEKAMPGCQILAARDGKVFFYKTYGYHTYTKNSLVTRQDLYDLASLTKVSATVPAVIKLQQEKKLNISSKLGKYLPEFDTCTKGDIVLSDMLLHQSGLKPWIPFYYSTIEPVYPSDNILSSKFSESYPIKIGDRAFVNKHLRYKDSSFSSTPTVGYEAQVAEGLYINSDVRDSIWIKIAESPLNENKSYKYSDLGFFLLFKVVESCSHVEFSKYVDSMFYKQLGAYTLCFNPLNKFNKQQIIPTENDIIFRRQVIHGYVHDPGAAMLGGVSGHAGLFGTANDLGKLFQMYLNGGTYGSHKYLDKKTLATFTSKIATDESNRRGLGFDKPYEDRTKNGPAFKGISPKSFGHTGFTGTMAWADPSTGILYIFLSNRVYPDASNNKLLQMDVRTKVQEAIYMAQIQDSNFEEPIFD